MAQIRILVVDDEIDFMNMVKFALEMAGDYEVRQVCSALRVLEVAMEFRPHIILLDCMMPEMNGTEVAAQLQADPVLHMTPFIFLTATVTEAQTRPDNRGVLQTYFPKPLRLTPLIRCIEEKTRGLDAGGTADGPQSRALSQDALAPRH